ncbi:hypothetical protein VF21_10267 [Pseudogymnoascus sp. 05NY08]|nr:hypothetical protein VF21_10267 [Pseudogymnoascus sp. 05NY08]
MSNIGGWAGTKARYFERLGSRATAGNSRGRLRMPRSQEASDVRGDEEGRTRGRSSGAQLSSFLHLDRSDDQTSMLKGLVAIAKSSVAWKAQSSEGVNRGCSVRSVHVPLWVLSCGEAEHGDPLGGAMQCGGCGGGQASHDERSRCEKVGREERRWRGTVGGREWPFYRTRKRRQARARAFSI